MGVGVVLMRPPPSNGLMGLGICLKFRIVNSTEINIRTITNTLLPAKKTSKKTSKA